MAAPKESISASGWALLREGRWEAARTAFQRAVSTRETPDAVEGLSWAAWWLDDEDAVLELRERAYRLYRAAGDAPAAARMATWMAGDQLDFRGASAVANGWLQRARRLLEPLEPCADHGWLDFMEGYMAQAAGDSETAAALGARAAELGRRLAVPDLEMLGLALEGSVLVARARVDDGMRCLDEATATALEGEAAIPISSAWACCFLVSSCATVRDYSRASEWCDRIAEFAERYGSRFMLAFCRAEYAGVQLWRGDWAEAEALLEAAIADFSRSRPAMAGGPMVALAELRRRQGAVPDAERLLAEAGASPAADVCRAQMALDRGEPLVAAESAERVLRQLPGDLRLARLPALEVLLRARAALPDIHGAARAAAEMRSLAEDVGTAPLAAGAELAAGMVAAAAGDHDGARPLLEDAVDGFERCGAPFDAAVARIELAEALAALGRPDAAAKQAEAARSALDRMGAAAEAGRARGVLAGPSPGAAAQPGVTRREEDVLRLLADGLTNREIAERLVVSEHTVHRHVTNILRKLDLPSRAAAAAHAVRSGLAQPRQ